MGLVTADISVSLDLIAAGHDQSLEHPFGPHVGERLHTWMFEHGDDNPDEVEARLVGPEPPYRAPVFVLCSRPRAPLTMAGGTTFHFVTEGAEVALERAREAAREGDVAIAGGPSTLNTYLAAGLVDELRLHIVPFTLGDGLRVFDGVGDLAMVPASSRTTPHVTHLTYRRT